MKIAVSASLFKLSKMFKKKNAKLYLVGGCVRNAIIGIPSFDVDICSSLKLSEAKTLLDGSEYIFDIRDEFLGTATITVNDAVWEYTVLRKEKYEKGGAHRPNEVEFIKNIEEDVYRRDFTVNAIYLDIASGELFDPLNATKDIKKKVLKTIDKETSAFENDGLRILRMVRFSSELNFHIDPKTFASAWFFKKNLSDISGVRKRNELIQLLKCSKKYVGHTKKFAYLRGLQKYNKLGIWKFFNLPIEKVRYSLVKKVDEDNRFLALSIDITSETCPHDRFAFLTNFLGGDGLNFASNKVEEMTYIICGYFDAIEKMNNKDYFFKYFNYFDRISPLLRKKSTKMFKKYTFFYKYLINNKIAIQIKDLDIKGGDIKKNYPNIPQKRYSYILNELLSKVFDGAIINRKNDLLEEVKNYDY